MLSFNSMEKKLDKIKKAIGNNGIVRINVFINEDKPIKVQFIFKKKIKEILCYSMEEYVELLYKHKGIEIIEFIGIKKPEPGDVKIAIS